MVEAKYPKLVIEIIIISIPNPGMVIFNKPSNHRMVETVKLTVKAKGAVNNKPCKKYFNNVAPIFFLVIHKFKIMALQLRYKVHNYLSMLFFNGESKACVPTFRRR